MNRRDVVQGLLLAAVVGGGVPTTHPIDAVAPKLGEHQAGWRIVVFDDRFAAARQFGRELGRSAWLARGIAGDITPLWHEMLDARWHRHATAVHGLTTAQSFFGLEQLAADRFWRATSQRPECGLLQWVLRPRTVLS